MELYRSSAALLASGGRIAATLVGLVGVGALVGWVRATAYFKYFGASWIVSALPFVEVMSWSLLPVLSAAGGVYIAVEMLEEHWPDDQVLRRSIYILLANLLVCLLSWAGSFFFPGYMGTSLGLLLWLGSLANGFVFVGLLTALRGDRGYMISAAGALCLVSFLLLTPAASGIISAREDCENDRLPVVSLRGKPAGDVRLLATSADRFYLVAHAGDCSLRPVVLAKAEEIEGILGRSFVQKRP